MNAQTGKFSLRRVFSLLFKLTALYVILWFVWRAGQPMEMPQFKGLSYYQFVQWRKMGYDDLARKYQERYPNKEVKFGMCFSVMQILHDPTVFFLTGYYTLSGMWRPLQIFVARRDRDVIPQDVTLWNFLPSWWKTFEFGVWNGAEHEPHTSVVYCRLAPNIPTPEQFEAMKEAYASERSTVSP
ncbi:MAG TPA: hypothetical protein VNK49_08885 [Anaerolineales bacterium]|nr:hypothetical protein [Anaerolineales bacterium]